MERRAQELIESLALEPHPEGGFYRQVFKSPRIVNGNRSAITAIHFLLPQGAHSRWHRVTSDEIWVNVEGGGVALHTFDGSTTRTQRLGATLPFAVVDAGVWQAAETIDGFALVACFVAPGFEFDDFTMMSDDREAMARLGAADARLMSLL
jgi:predicted cupin superfamily sugar epimerase